MKLLLIDENDQRRQSYCLYFDNIFHGVEIIEKNSVSESLHYLEKFKSVDLIISTDEIIDGSVGTLFTELKQNFSFIPFIFVSEKSLENFPELDGFRSVNYKNGLIKLPTSPAHFREQLLNIFNPSSINLERVSAFQKVRLIHFLRFNKSLCDIYIKLSPSKYVKVLNKNHYYNREDITKYKIKGVKHFYLKNQDYEKFHHCFSTIPFLIKCFETDHASEELLSITHEVLQDLVLSIGVTENVVKFTNNTINEIVQIMKRDDKIYNMITKVRSKEDYLYDHSYLVAIISCYIMSNVEINSVNKASSVCMASLFHDIVLENPSLSLISSADDPRLQLFAKKDIDLYLNHPKASAELLRSSSVISGDVLNIIEHHHEGPNGKGFPHQLHPSRLSDLTCIFIVAHEFVEQMYLCDFDTEKVKKVIDDISVKYFSDNFKVPVTGLQYLLIEGVTSDVIDRIAV